MRKKLIVIIILIAIAGTAFGYYVFGQSGKTSSQFKTTEITRGNLENTISASGTLSPVTTVEIGTQVSGTIAEVFVDFNDEVTEGQLLAVLDTVVLKSSILDAEANLEKASAQLEQAQVEHEKYLSLYEKNLISELEYLPYKIALKSQNASLKSAQSALERAERNLGYAFIKSPINGTVIQKSVEAGQTVAASLSTPTLFIIAENLERMEILAAVDESDIGEIKKGQAVRFEVQAYSDKEFTGTVTQIRLQPETVSNVVTYTVVVDAANENDLLLPGMTASIEFIIESRENVLLVPNSALKFQPSEEIAAKFFEQRRHKFDSLPDSVKEHRANRRANMNRSSQSGENPGRGNDSDRGQLWYYDVEGNLAMAPVRVGMSDGKNTEIVMSRDLDEGSVIISGFASATDIARSNQSSSRMRSPMRGGRPPRF